MRKMPSITVDIPRDDRGWPMRPDLKPMEKFYSVNLDTAQIHQYYFITKHPYRVGIVACELHNVSELVMVSGHAFVTTHLEEAKKVLRAASAARHEAIIELYKEEETVEPIPTTATPAVTPEVHFDLFAFAPGSWDTERFYQFDKKIKAGDFVVEIAWSEDEKRHKLWLRKARIDQPNQVNKDLSNIDRWAAVHVPIALDFRAVK